MLARWGKLDLPSFLIMVAMFGGIVWIGAADVVLGPLALRLAKEALVIARERREAARGRGRGGVATRPSLRGALRRVAVAPESLAISRSWRGRSCPKTRRAEAKKRCDYRGLGG